MSPPLLRAGLTSHSVAQRAGTGLPRDRVRTIGKFPGTHNRELTMKRLAFAVGVLALGFAAATPARADFAVVKFELGFCRIWWDTGTPSRGAPAGPSSRTRRISPAPGPRRRRRSRQRSASSTELSVGLPAAARQPCRAAAIYRRSFSGAAIFSLREDRAPSAQAAQADERMISCSDNTTFRRGR